MANQLIARAVMAQALCIEVARAFEARSIKTIPHDRWNIELRGDETGLNLVWYDLPPMREQDLCLGIERFADRFFRNSAEEIASMVFRLDGAPIEMLTLGSPPNLDFSQHCHDHGSGVTVHMYRTYDAITNTMPWWARLAYRVHTEQSGPPIEFCIDAMRLLGILDCDAYPGPHEIEVVRSRWRPGMTSRQLAGAIAPRFGVKSPLSIHEQYMAGPVGFNWYMDQSVPSGPWPWKNP